MENVQNLVSFDPSVLPSMRNIPGGYSLAISCEPYAESLLTDERLIRAVKCALRFHACTSSMGEPDVLLFLALALTDKRGDPNLGIAPTSPSALWPRDQPEDLHWTISTSTAKHGGRRFLTSIGRLNIAVIHGNAKAPKPCLTCAIPCPQLNRKHEFSRAHPGAQNAETQDISLGPDGSRRVLPSISHARKCLHVTREATITLKPWSRLLSRVTRARHSCVWRLSASRQRLHETGVNRLSAGSSSEMCRMDAETQSGGHAGFSPKGKYQARPSETSSGTSLPLRAQSTMEAALVEAIEPPGRSQNSLTLDLRSVLAPYLSGPTRSLEAEFPRGLSRTNLKTFPKDSGLIQGRFL
ncbi:hypothetical protein B0H14DRAFT_3786446 [Mycena olivaceomarginata]|nr:hypothetical protein B0H14DRAFT_3786446 [Mycena olivaceomarginata]